MEKTLHLLFLALFTLSFSACDGAGVDGTPPSLEKLGQKGGKADEWGPSDDPRLFSETLEYRLEELPREGEAESIPWAGSYWPVYEDSINKRWDGENSQSASEKYGTAFGIDGVEDAVSAAHGIDQQVPKRKACTTDSDCDEPTDGACAKRRGASDGDAGVCIPTWWGICHAWAPVAIMEPEPKFPVTKNGVEFKVNDIKALITLTYNRVASKFISLRCNEDEDDLEYDLYDRPTSDACNNTNPGTMHVIMANYLGLMKQAFAEDRTFDDEVWNQPVRGFEVKELIEITGKEANMKVGVVDGPAAGQVFEFDGQVEGGEWLHYGPYDVTSGDTMEVTMAASDTAGNRADLYVRFGNEPTAGSFDCGPSGAAPNEDCELVVPAGATQVYMSVLATEGSPEFTVEADLNKGNIVSVPEAYMFNDKARKLFYVRTEVEYISESDSNVDGNLAETIDDYTRTDYYRYILELDEEGKIIGGEWVGSSKKTHPDFLWLPTGRYSAPVAQGKIRYEDIKTLLDASQSESSDANATGAASITKVEAGSVGQDAMVHFGPFTAGTGAISVLLSGSGDGDLYVKMGAQPTTSDWDCRPYENGSSESCTLEGPGTFYVAVFGFKESNFEVTLSFMDPSGPTDPAEPVTTPDTVHLAQAGHVAEGQMVHYSLNVTANRPVVVRTECLTDIDVYVRMNVKPSEAVYDQRAFTYTGNEKLTIIPAADGVLHIGVHGYDAGDFTLTTAAE